MGPQSAYMSSLRRLRALSSMATYEDFFRHTSGRWLHDEQRHLALRYQRFNVDALKGVAAASAKAPYATDIRKIEEGRCNKVFKVQLSEGGLNQVIARIPTPLAGPPHLVTASEVATIPDSTKWEEGSVRSKCASFLPTRVDAWEPPTSFIR